MAGAPWSWGLVYVIAFPSLASSILTMKQLQSYPFDSHPTLASVL